MGNCKAYAPPTPHIAGHNEGNSYQSLLRFIHAIRCHCFMNNWPKEACFLMCFVLVANDVPPQKGRERNSFCHLLGIDFLRASWVVIHFLPSLARYARKGFTSCHHHCVRSNKYWSNVPKREVKLSSGTASRHPFHHDLWHPTRESHGVFRIPCI